MKLHCHIATGREIEKVIGKEAVMVRYGEIHSLREFVSRHSYSETAAYGTHLRTDSWLRHCQVFERCEKVIVAGIHFAIHQQLTIDNYSLAIRPLQKFRYFQIYIRATR